MQSLRLGKDDLFLLRFENSFISQPLSLFIYHRSSFSYSVEPSNEHSWLLGTK